MACQGFDHLFFADQDTAPCVSSRKSKVQQCYPGLPDDRIIVVSREIESWFLAGIGPDQARRFGIPVLDRTEQVSKAEFDEYQNRKTKFDSDIDFMAEIVKIYSISEAAERNRAFNYFYRRFFASASSSFAQDKLLPFDN